MSTGASYESKSSDLKVYICSVLIHFEHLPAPTYLGCAVGSEVLADVGFKSVPLSVEYFLSEMAQVKPTMGNVNAFH